MQLPDVGHETPDKLQYSAPRGFAVCCTAQELPSHRSATAAVPASLMTWPTAVQAAAEAQETELIVL